MTLVKYKTRKPKQDQVYNSFLQEIQGKPQEEYKK
jgi:hypothetical protein